MGWRKGLCNCTVIHFYDDFMVEFKRLYVCLELNIVLFKVVYGVQIVEGFYKSKGSACLGLGRI